AHQARGRLQDAGLARQSQAVEQEPDGRQHRDQHPDAVDPAAQGLGDVGLENRPVGEPAVDGDGLLGRLGVHASPPHAASRTLPPNPRASSFSTRSRNACSVCCPTLRTLTRVTLLSCSVISTLASAAAAAASSCRYSSRRRWRRLTSLNSPICLTACAALAMAFCSPSRSSS